MTVNLLFGLSVTILEYCDGSSGAGLPFGGFVDAVSFNNFVPSRDDSVGIGLATSNVDDDDSTDFGSARLPSLVSWLFATTVWSAILLANVRNDVRITQTSS